MEDLIFVVAAGLLVLFQVLSCVFAKRAWLRWLPFLISLALMAFCFVLYGLSGWTNWAYIILIALLGLALMAQGAVLLINRLVRWMLKR